MFKISFSILTLVLFFNLNAFAAPTDYNNQAPAATQSSHNGKDCGPCDSASWNPDYPEQTLDNNSKKTDETYAREVLAGTRRDGSNEIPGMPPGEDK